MPESFSSKSVLLFAKSLYVRGKILKISVLYLSVLCSFTGDKTQQDRDYVLAEFKKGACDILIATDVASRGLGMNISILGVTCVYNVQLFIRVYLINPCSPRCEGHWDSYQF